MCGICGYVGFQADDQLLQRMTATMAHRGPDDDGCFTHGMVGLGMRRLSIIDVAGGQQPIFNEDKSAAIIFNGEIYNYRALVDDLVQRGHAFRTRSDTETILHLYGEYGTDCVQHLNGMFAFAIYDIRQQQLFVARDRLGIKPLYYWWQQGKLVFASEIKVILACPDVPREPYLPAIDAYMSLRYVPGPETMLANIHKLPAAHWLRCSNGQIQIERYWSPQPAHDSYQPDEYYRERFAELFRESVQMRLMSEVPLGVFLSGGVDSSAIVATMSQMVSQPVRTFSVGFDWSGDELSAAQQVAEQAGCDHHEITCRTADLELLPKIVWHLDEPVGDGIVLPMYLLSQLARQHVTVVLTGDGADETLAGYLPHKVLFWAQQYAHQVPYPAQRIGRLMADSIPASTLNMIFPYPDALGERGRRKVLDYLALVGDKSVNTQYNFLVSLFDERDKASLYTPQMQANLWQDNGGLYPDSHDASPLNKILAWQYAHWLPDDILMKQDKTTMANAIEGRVPFLDHRLVEFLFQTPPHLKLNGLRDKVMLRDYLAKALPGYPTHRPKKPFYIPMDQYFGAGPLSDIVQTCLSEESVRRRGYFQWEHVQKLRQSVGKSDFLFGKQVFSLVVLELWHRIFIDQERGWVA